MRIETCAVLGAVQQFFLGSEICEIMNTHKS